MNEEHSEDLDAEILRMMEEDGNDMQSPMLVDFHVAAPTEDVALKIAEAAATLGYETEIDFDDGEDLEDPDDELTEPWTCICSKTMVLTHEAVIAAQRQLDEIARPLGGYSDGWGTMGNLER